MKKNKSTKEKIVLGMIMLADDEFFDPNAFISDFDSHYYEKIYKSFVDKSALVVMIDDEMITIGHVLAPIPPIDIAYTAHYAYNWPTAASDAAKHTSHLIVACMGQGENQIIRHKIFTQVVSSIFRTTRSIGLYMGSRSLLIPKEDYIKEATLMAADYLPLNLWIYFGLIEKAEGNSGYTYGMKEFGKLEMEIQNSQKSLEEVRGFLFNVAHYVLEFDVTFKGGQTIGLSEDERIPISHSKGKFVEGNTFKLLY